MRFVKALGALSALVLVIAAGVAVWGWVQVQAFVEATPSSEHDERIVTIPRGAGPQAIARLLAEQGVVTDAERFALFLRWKKAAPRLRAGEFRFHTDLRPAGVLEVLLEAKEVTYPITFPEGLRYREMAQRVEDAGVGTAAEYVALAEDAEFIAGLGLGFDAPNLEGILLPETYAFAGGSTVRDVVTAQVDRFKALWDARRLARATELRMSPYEVVVLASVVEKETGQPAERPLIAGVFHNRLRLGMPLQSDPTIIYGLKNYDGNIRRKDIRATHPWNTYVIPALPPTPIAGAGVAAIDAVLWPDETKALYFVAKGRTGAHHFSATLSEHNAAVDCYQRNRPGRCP